MLNCRRVIGGEGSRDGILSSYWWNVSAALPVPSLGGSVVSLGDDQYRVYYNIQTQTRTLLLLHGITKKKLS